MQHPDGARNQHRRDALAPETLSRQTGAHPRLELNKDNRGIDGRYRDEKATAIYRYALYTLHPKKRLIDKGKALHEEADLSMKAGDHDRALELISLAKKWHCPPGVLYTRALINYPRER
jgi:hypothetical protein